MSDSQTEVESRMIPVRERPGWEREEVGEVREDEARDEACDGECQAGGPEWGL